MSLFGSDDTDDENEQNDLTDEPEPEEEEETVTTTETREKDYTEHTATVEFTDGTEREWTFDGLNTEGSAYTLKNYTGVLTKDMEFFGHQTKFASEAFASIPKRNVKVFETTERREECIEYEVEVEKPASEVDGE